MMKWDIIELNLHLFTDLLYTLIVSVVPHWNVNKGNEWFFDEKHDKMNGKIEQI